MTATSATAAPTAPLAVDGGTPIRTAPMPPRRLFGEEEKAAANRLFEESIRTGGVFGYGGKEEDAYCQAFAELLGGGFADGVNSGSSAVYVALRALDLEPFTEVVVPALTDPGGIMPVPLLNCIPIVADTRPDSYNVGPDEVEAVLSPRTSAIVVAHICGEPVDMDPILEIARAHNLPVIEDCAQAHGARYKGKLVGSLGTIAAFSTMSGKHHATGAQGGVVFTRSEALYWQARRMSDRGKPFAPAAGSPLASSAAARAGAVGASLNLNSNDLAAAIGRVQLAKLPGIVAARQRVAGQIAAGLAARSRAVSAGWILEGAESAYWFMRLHVDQRRTSVDGNTFARALAKEGFPISPSYSGALQGTAEWLNERRVFGTSGYPWAAPEYRARGGDPERRFACPNALAVLASDCNLHLTEAWTDQEVADFLAAVEKVERAYTSG